MEPMDPDDDVTVALRDVLAALAVIEKLATTMDLDEGLAATVTHALFTGDATDPDLLIQLERHLYTADQVASQIEAAGLNEVCRLVRRAQGKESDDQAVLLAKAD